SRWDCRGCWRGRGGRGRPSGCLGRHRCRCRRRRRGDTNLYCTDVAGALLGPADTTCVCRDTGRAIELTAGRGNSVDQRAAAVWQLRKDKTAVVVRCSEICGLTDLVIGPGREATGRAPIVLEVIAV